MVKLTPDSVRFYGNNVKWENAEVIGDILRQFAEMLDNPDSKINYWKNRSRVYRKIIRQLNRAIYFKTQTIKILNLEANKVSIKQKAIKLKDSNGLKPCPRCGESENVSLRSNEHRHIIRCDDCDCFVNRLNKEEAIETWNNYGPTKEKDTIELKLCPFCGKSKNVKIATDGPKHIIKCIDCLAFMVGYEKAALIKVWNNHNSIKGTFMNHFIATLEAINATDWRIDDA